MKHLGDFDAAAAIYGKFTTFRPSTAAPFTLAGTPAISVYKDNSTTESTAGVTLTADFDSRTGLNHFTIDTSADGTFYSAGSFFDIVITTGTVDSVSVVGSVVGSFTLRKTAALKPTTAGRTFDVSAGGEGGIDWANIGSPTTSVNLSGTTVKTATDVETDTADIQTRLPAALVSGRMDSSVGAMAANVLTATAINADAFTAAKFAADVTTELQTGLATASAVATLQTSVDDIPTNAELATALGTADDAVLAQLALVKAKTDNLPSDPADASDIATAFDVVGSAISGLSIPTAAAVADAVWDEAIAGHVGAGSTGEALAAAGGTAPTATEIADAVLRRQFDDVDDTGASRDLLACGRMIRNGFAPITGTDLEVLKEDDTTVAWTRTLTTDPAAEPIVGVGGP